MQFDVAGTLFASVKWYFAPSGAKDFPGSHLFCSNDFQEHGYVSTDPGVYWNQLPVYYNGALPAPFTGDGPPCAPLDWWLNGVPSNALPLALDPRGIPVCCSVAVSQLGKQGVALGVKWAPCQPWRIFGPPARTFKRVLTGETWIQTLSNAVQWSGHGVVHVGEIVNPQTGGLGCQGFNLTKQIPMVTPTTGGTARLTLLTYNPTTFTGIWQMSANSIRYAGEHFTWTNPTV